MKHFVRRLTTFGFQLRHWLPVRLFALLWTLNSCSLLRSESPDFQRDILPVLQAHCLECHGAENAEANLRLDSPVAALRGGDSGEPAIVPGESHASYLLARVLMTDPHKRMPPDSPPLTEAEIAKLRNWIEDTNAWHEAQKQLDSEVITHWSFQPVVKPDLPEGRLAASAIDAFVQEKLREKGLAPSPRATRQQLIRRLCLVLHGIPPSVEQVERFERDEDPRAWENLIEEALASPRFGEQFATQWLDLVHFGETHGFETNRERPHAWHYRDYVINAFNDDKPYDRFIFEQLAGDAVGVDVATGFLVAGPYDLVKGQDPLLRLMQREDELADIINTTGTAFLGLTLGCARCHNHKFDPISQTDYYALKAVFAGVNHADRSLPLTASEQQQLAAFDEEIANLQGKLAVFLQPPAGSVSTERTLRPPVNAKLNTEIFPPTTARFARFTISASTQSQPCIDELEIFAGSMNVALASAGAKATSGGDFVHPLHKLEHIHDGLYGNSKSWIASQASGGWVQLEFPKPVEIDRIVWGRDREGQFQDRLATEYRIETSLDGTSWQAVASSVDRQPYAPDKAKQPHYFFDDFPVEQAKQGKDTLEQLNRVNAEREKLAKGTLVYAGTFSQPGPTHRLYRGEPTAPREPVAPGAIASLTDLQLPETAPEQQRRQAIAQWIASPQNPLTARVMVNRLWQFHFGTGIVETSSDFGANGTPPLHPELLDWLAAELMENQWSLKHLHRLILQSSTWQQETRPRAEAIAIDADARLLWRFPPRRISAEGIRDSVLAVTGKLDLQQGGPGFSAFEVEMENVRHYFPKSNFGSQDWRRMIYMTRVRQEKDAVFGAFDCPDFSQVVPKRNRSTTPLQALNLLNSRFMLQQCDLFVERLHRDAPSVEEQIKLAYRLAYGRFPNAEEIDSSKQFIAQTNWQQFARAILNSNEFLFIP